MYLFTCCSSNIREIHFRTDSRPVQVDGREHFNAMSIFVIPVWYSTAISTGSSLQEPLGVVWVHGFMGGRPSCGSASPRLIDVLLIV